MPNSNISVGGKLCGNKFVGHSNCLVKVEIRWAQDPG